MGLGWGCGLDLGGGVGGGGDAEESGPLQGDRNADGDQAAHGDPNEKHPQKYFVEEFFGGGADGLGGLDGGTILL